MKIVIMTVDHSMGRSADRAMLRDNQRWAGQVAARSANADHDIRHHHVRGPHGNAAAVRRTMVRAYSGAATVAGPNGRILVMVGHGSGAMCDLGPAPHFRVDMDVVRASNNFSGSHEHGSEAESLLSLRDAIQGRVRELYLATCNLARGTGPSFLRSLGAVLQDGGRPTLYGLDGFLWSSEEGGQTVMGVTPTRGARPARVYADRIWTSHWYRQRMGGGFPARP